MFRFFFYKMTGGRKVKKFINNLKKEEKAVLDLRKLYESYGYKKIKLNKFEEYELYNDNKDFLKTENILTFMDLNGKLQALRPDVTLSVVKKVSKNNKNGTEKLYYIENIYRLSKETREYEELEQLGIELIGDIDKYSNLEIIDIVLESLKIINENYILDISHLGFVSGLLEEMKLDYSLKNEVLKNIHLKNRHDLERLLKSVEIPEKYKNYLLKIPNLSGNYKEVLDEAETLVVNEKMANSIRELRELSEIFDLYDIKNKVLLDFSIVNNLDYYNGIIFQGYIENNPRVVLSGGRYDKLAEKFVANKKAVGFAIFLDELAKYNKNDSEYDFDILILYKDGDYSILLEKVKEFIKNGNIVRTDKYNENYSMNFNYREKYIFCDNKLKREV